jgi:hypothetical protein
MAIRRRSVSGIDHSRITDQDGRHIPVVRAKLPAKANPAPIEPKLRTAVEFRRELDSISSGIRRLAPQSSSDPERFYEQRSELARRVQRLAATLDEAR